jgi:hypothetical protein
MVYFLRCFQVFLHVYYDDVEAFVEVDDGYFHNSHVSTGKSFFCRLIPKTSLHHRDILFYKLERKTEKKGLQ